MGSRRICLSQLLDFYARLGERGCPGERTLMPHFDPNRSTTNDVVRHAIIPESRCGHFGKALAQVLPRRPRNRWRSPRPVMVMHHWANSFRDLVAAVVANGLGLKRWDSIAEQLSSCKEQDLKESLYKLGAADCEYWICAICVNQHASICGSSMGVRDTVTGEVLPWCDCSTPKYFNDQPVQCKLNKFDSMMAHLHDIYKGGFLQVVAIDKGFQLFSRAWCVAELVEANSRRMEQHVMLHSPEPGSLIWSLL